MPIIVEDGSIVADANSYVSLADCQTYLTDRGYDITSLDDAKMILGYDYVNSFENQYQGSRVSADQTGSFPRYGVCVNGFPLDNDKIPQQLIDAQCMAAYYESQQSGILFSVGTGQTITHEEVTGEVAVDYADNGINSDTFNFSSIDALLQPLFGMYSASLRVFRV